MYYILVDSPPYHCQFWCLDRKFILHEPRGVRTITPNLFIELIGVSDTDKIIKADGFFEIDNVLTFLVPSPRRNYFKVLPLAVARIPPP